MGISCKILAIDGGGIRGIIPAYIIQQLEARLNKPAYTQFEIISGTSTGGIITLALTTPANDGHPYSGSEILNLYMTDESRIFVEQSSGDFTESKYYAVVPNSNPPSGVEPWLQSKLSRDLTLSQARQKLISLGQPVPEQVLTTCYTINGAEGIEIGPYLFNWVDASRNSGDDYFVWEAARATSAAPTYFPIANVGSGAPNGSQAVNRWAADGGVAANNPALYALAWATRLGLIKSLSDALVVSLGTGLYNVGIRIPGEGNWGTIQWAAGFDTGNHPTSPLLNILAMSNVLSPDQQLEALLPTGSYFRLEPDIPYAEAVMDGTDIKDLLATAQTYIGEGGAGSALFEQVIRALTA